MTRLALLYAFSSLPARWRSTTTRRDVPALKLRDLPMFVRQLLHERLANTEVGHRRSASLPTALRRDPAAARTLLQQGLAASRLFAMGDKAGVLSAAQRRSGRPFRLDLRQRVIVKALVARHRGGSRTRGQALGAHVAYLGRSGAGPEGDRAAFFDRDRDDVDAAAITAGWSEDRHHFRFIVSPEHGDRIADLRDFVRDMMGRVAADLGEPQLAWVAACHYDTDQPHAHILLRGRRGDGRDLVIPRDYIAYGLRGRAAEVAQERLGDLSRAEAERRIWRETTANRFTGFDRRLLQALDVHGLVDDGVGAHDAWSALTRGRLRHLEALGLARRTGRRYRLDPDIEAKLRGLQLRQDVIRTVHQRRLESGRDVQPLDRGRVRGQVVARGRHDELGAVSWVIVRDRTGAEHYARLPFGTALPEMGRAVELRGGERGVAVLRTIGTDLQRP